MSVLAEPFDTTLTAITQHVRVLEAAHLIDSTKRGRQRVCALERDTLGRAEKWLADRRLAWDHRLDRLEQHLHDTENDTPADHDATKDPER